MVVQELDFLEMPLLLNALGREEGPMQTHAAAPISGRSPVQNNLLRKQPTSLPSWKD